MKKSIFTIALVLFATVLSYANNDEKYLKAVGSTLPNLYKARTLEEMTPIINKLNRIAAAEPNKWEPTYYVAYAYIVLSQTSETPADKDKYIDIALEQIKKGKTIAPEEPELEALSGYALMMKMVVDPMSRAQQYSAMVFGAFQKAIRMDDSNPRAWMLLGQMQLGTAKFMGTSTEEGCSNIQKAITLFENQELTSVISPSWGLGSAQHAAQQCQ